MGIGQRFFDAPQFAAELARFIYFMSFFHPNDLTIADAAQLPHPAHHRSAPFDFVFALHSGGTTLACFHLAHALHFKPFAITNCLHGYLVFFITKYQPISGRDPNCELPTFNVQLPTSKSKRAMSSLDLWAICLFTRRLEITMRRGS